jgi:hypothetical protein
MLEFKETFISNSSINPSVSSVNPTSPPQFEFFTWGLPGKQAKLHMVPQGWILPTTNISNIWNLWWFGHLEDKIQPYRFLKADDLANSAQISQFSKLKKVMNSIDLIAHDKQYIEQGKLFSELNKEQCNEIFKQAFGELTKQLYPTETNTRSGELSIATIYDRLCTRNNNNKRKHDEIEEKQLLANNMEL